MRPAALAAVLALALCAPGALAHVYFVANLTSSGAAGSSGASLVGYTHHDEFYWTLTGVQGLTGASIVDGKPGGGSQSSTAVKLDVSAPLAGSPPTYNSSFAAAAISPDVAASVTELAGHMCMGHIFVAVDTADGMLTGPMVYTPEEAGSATCDDAVGAHHGSVESTATAAAAAPGAAPPSSAFARLPGAGVSAAVAVAALLLLA